MFLRERERERERDMTQKPGNNSGKYILNFVEKIKKEATGIFDTLFKSAEKLSQEMTVFKEKSKLLYILYGIA